MAAKPKLYYQRAAALGLVRGEQAFEPYRKPTRVPRFLVPKGTRCTVRNIVTDKRVTFTTTKDNGFERFERYERTEAGNFYEFRQEGYLLRVHRRHVIHREDTYRSPAAPA
jgi:hypothetical protein